MCFRYDGRNTITTTIRLPENTALRVPFMHVHRYVHGRSEEDLSKQLGSENVYDRVKNILLVRSRSVLCPNHPLPFPIYVFFIHVAEEKTE